MLCVVPRNDAWWRHSHPGAARCYMGSKVKVKVAQWSPTLWPHGLFSPSQNPGVGSFSLGRLSLLQRIFLTQGSNPGLLHWSNPGLLHCGWILNQLSQQGIPEVLEWVAYPFSSRSSWSRNWTRVSCITSAFLPTELTGKPWYMGSTHLQNQCWRLFTFFRKSGNPLLISFHWRKQVLM